MSMKTFKVTQMRGDDRPHVTDVRVGENKLGQILYFETDQKYVNVWFACTGSTLIAMISPDELWCEDCDRYLTSEDSEFYDHPDYFSVEIEIPTGGKYVTTLTTALKHQYFVNIIDTNDACDYEAVGIK
jgi:hypothetical protein